LAGFPAKPTGVGASATLRQQARPKQTPDAHTNPSPNPCKGNQPETPGRRKHRARFATQLYPIRRNQTMTHTTQTTARYVGIDVSQNTRTIAIYPTDADRTV